MTKPEIKIFRNSHEIAGYIRKILSNIDTSNEFNLALSGGKTPKLIYSCLSKSTSPSIPWDNVRFYWGDERCVPPTNKESNYLMARTTLLDKINVPENHIFRIMGENDPSDENERYSHLILANNKGLFDLILLGLGNDGHTASIFPNQMHLLSANEICKEAIKPESEQLRITLTGSVINNSKSIMFIVTGSDKAGIVRDILKQKGQWEKYPASYIKPNRGRLIWLLDKEAAAEL